MPEVLATFRGPVSCRRAADIPRLTLTGRTTEAPDEDTAVAFSAAAPAELPDTLEDVVVERLSEAQCRISSAPRAWLVNAAAVHVHGEIAAQFYRAIPPRAAPWTKRLMWRFVLALAASRAGIALLRLLRR
jgi:hypothetical protein